MRVMTSVRVKISKEGWEEGGRDGKQEERGGGGSQEGGVYVQRSRKGG